MNGPTWSLIVLKIILESLTYIMNFKYLWLLAEHLVQLSYCKSSIIVTRGRQSFRRFPLGLPLHPAAFNMLLCRISKLDVRVPNTATDVDCHISLVLDIRSFFHYHDALLSLQLEMGPRAEKVHFRCSFLPCFAGYAIVNLILYLRHPGRFEYAGTLHLTEVPIMMLVLGAKNRPLMVRIATSVSLGQWELRVRLE